MALAAPSRPSRCLGAHCWPSPRCIHTGLATRLHRTARSRAADPAAVDIAQTACQQYLAAQDSRGSPAAVPSRHKEQPIEQADPGSLAGAAALSSTAGGQALSAQAEIAQRLARCPECTGSGRVLCQECEGRGYLKRGGYNKKNPLNMSRLTGSKWTAMQETLGWRHFRVIQLRKLDKNTVYLLLQASCDSSAQLWVNAQNLRNRSSWAAGWLQMSEIQGLGAEIQGAGHKCQSCSGLGYKACVVCDGTGRPQLIIL